MVGELIEIPNIGPVEVKNMISQALSFEYEGEWIPDEKLVGKEVELCGWVDSIRILKAVIFVVIRDRYGK